MIFTDWEWITGIKFGAEICQGTFHGEALVIKIDLVIIRVRIGYYGTMM